MAVVVSRKIRAQEFGARLSKQDREVLRRSARVALATNIAAKGLPPATRLLKAYATSPRGPRRIAYLLAVADDTLFLLFYRDKNDDVGTNMSPKNPEFSRQLHKHLDWLQADIESGDFEVIETAEG